MGFHVYDTETKDFNEILTAEALSKKVYDTLNFYQKRCEMLTKANQELMDNATKNGLIDSKTRIKYSHSPNIMNNNLKNKNLSNVF